MVPNDTKGRYHYSIMFPIAQKKKKTPSPPPFITDYKLSYKNCKVAISVRPIVSKWVCSLGLGLGGHWRIYLAKCRS